MITIEQVREPVPCVVYLHGNSGSRLDADDLVDVFLAEQVLVVCMWVRGG